MMKKLSILYCFIFLTVLPTSAQSQNFIHYTVGENIYDVAVAPNGSIWVATLGGLVFFDSVGQPPQFFNRGNTTLPANNIWSVSVGPDGALWLGTEIGLVRWKDGISQIYNPPPSNPWHNPQLVCHTVRATPEGKVWVCEMQDRLWLFDNGVWTFFPKSIFGEDVVIGTNFKMLPDGSLWLLGIRNSKPEFFHFDGQTLTNLTLTPNLSSIVGNDVTNWDVDPNTGRVAFVIGKSVCTHDGMQWNIENTGFWGDHLTVTPDGRIWMYDDFDGISSRGPGEANWVNVMPNSNFPIDCKKIVTTPEGNLLLLGGNGLYLFDNSLLVKLSTSQSNIPNNSIAHLAITGEQTVWGSFGDFELSWHSGKDLACFVDGKWHSLSDSIDELRYKGVKGLAVDGLDRLWAATFTHGLLRWDGASWASIPTPEMPAGQIYSICARPGGTEIWIGGWLGKVGRLNPDNSLEIYDTPTPGSMVTTICADFEGGLWVPNWAGDTPGVARLTGQTWTTFSSQDMGLTFTGYINKIACAPDGKIWVLTQDGVAVYDGTQWKPISNNLPAPYAEYISIAFDGDRVWLGQHHLSCFAPTSMLYLIKYENNSIELYPYMSTPLPYPNITALAVDGHHNLWIGTENGGIAVFNEQGVTLGSSSSQTAYSSSVLNVNASPNPAEHSLRIVFELPRSADVSLEIFDMASKSVYSDRREWLPQGQNVLDVAISSLPNGIYAWHLKSEAGSVSGKVVVQR
jgi:ligand-binding sensor domain-containing protein